MKKLLNKLVKALLIGALAYVAVAVVVFRYRHPWATDAEHERWVWSALRFKSVPYDVMRPREAK